MNATDPTCTRMYQEAAEAAQVVARQRGANADTVAMLASRWRAAPPRLLATMARGSSDHAATYLRYLVETRLGIVAASMAPSIASIYEARPKLDGALAVAVSQSGASPDLLAMVAAARSGGAETLALVNVEESPLATAVDVVLPLHAGPETSVAATKTAIATLAQMADLVAEWSADDDLRCALNGLPAALDRAWVADWTPLVDGLSDAKGLFVVGRGYGLGVAQEAALKLKETCGLHAEAFSAAEVRHGPMALIGRDFPVLLLRQDDETADGLNALAAALSQRGGPVFVASAEDAKPGTIGLPGIAAHPVLQPILHLQSFYRAANALAARRGFDPDRPPYLAKNTETT